MTDHPVLFKADMVRAILDGRKTQTRRIIPGEIHINPSRTSWHWHKPRGGYMERHDERHNDRVFRNILADHCPCGVPGDLLWVRENTRTICYSGGPDFGYGEFCIEYLADEQLVKCPDEQEDWWRHKWHVRPSTTIPSIHMHKWACRLWLKVKSVRVERVQEISQADAIAEGVLKDDWCGCSTGCHLCMPYHTAEDCWETEAFGMLWDSINAKGGYGWDKNPWVWKIDFERYDK